MERQQNTDALLEILNLEGKAVVDVGAGAGHLVRLMAESGAHVTGVECNDDQRDRALAEPPVADETYLDGVGQALPLPDSSQDVVVFFNSLHHVPPEHQDAALAEAARVLKAEGTVYISEPVAEGTFFEVTRLVADETEVRARAREVIENAGRHGLMHHLRKTVVHTTRLPDFDTLCQRIGATEPERGAIVEDNRDALYEAFHTNADRDADGNYTFDQPTRIDVLYHRPLTHPHPHASSGPALPRF